MRKVANVFAVILIVISLSAAVFPLGTLGLLPPGLAIVFSGIAFFSTAAPARKFPKILLIVSILLFVLIAAKAMMPNEVAQDTEFEQQKIESRNQDLQDLESLEGDLE